MVKINTHSANANVRDRMWRPAFFAAARARRRASAACAGSSRWACKWPSRYSWFALRTRTGRHRSIATGAFNVASRSIFCPAAS